MKNQRLEFFTVNTIRRGYSFFIVFFLPLVITACTSSTPAPVVERGTPPSSSIPTPTAAAISSATATTSAVRSVPATGTYVVKKGDTLYSIALDHGLDYRDLAQWNSIDNPAQIKVGQQLNLASPNPSSAVVVNPVTTAAPVESRSLEPAIETKTQPKAVKLPYSDQAYARLQAEGNPQTPPVAPVVAAKPEPKPEVKTESKVTESGAEEYRVDWGWPVKGKVINHFSGGPNGKGIGIAARMGDPVVASAPGKVIYTGTKLVGYGQLIIIKHNNLFLSVYAYNNQIFVKEGQQVLKGQRIGEVGQADDKQAKLHFEIRRQGNPVDPLKYLPSS